MTDTPQHIHELQLKLWLSKSPGERLLQFLTDNDDMLKAINETKKKLNIPIIKFTSKEETPLKWKERG
jgi:hypothetical protein